MNVKNSYKKSDSVRTLLLDTAETLFAERGFFGVSIRDITEEADLRNASINYHFKSKENLFLAVIDRRIAPLSEARLSKLSKLEIDLLQPDRTVRGIVEAFALPMLDFAENGGTGWKNYCIIVAHLAVQKIWNDNIVSAKYDDHSRQFIEALRQTFPSTSDHRIQYCFQFLLSATLYAVCDNKRIDTLSNGALRSDDLTRLRDPFIDFTVGGILSAAGQP